MSHDLIEMVRQAVCDEAGSQLCYWRGAKRFCPKRDGISSICLCERVGKVVIIATLEAIREPTVAQERAGGKEVDDYYRLGGTSHADVGDIYIAMIDALRAEIEGG